MLKLYYKIWVDTLVKLRSQQQNKGKWKILSFVFISMAMALNFILLISIFQRNILNYTFYSFDLDIFPGTKLDALLKFIILFLLPVVTVNYFLIFHNKKYEYLIQKYKSYNGKLGIIYLLTSYFFTVLTFNFSFFI